MVDPLCKKALVPSFYKVLLVVILPIPPACMAWTVTYWGPDPGDMETVKPIHYAAVAELIFEGLGAGALSMVVLFSAKLAGGRIKERWRKRKERVLSQEALDSIDDWTESRKRDRHRRTARELLGKDGKPEKEEEKRVTSRTYFGRAPD